MQKPLQITYRNMDPSDAMDNTIREKANKLSQFFANIIGCKVVIEQVHKHHKKGNNFQVKIDITVPGKELVITNGQDQHHSYTDAYVAIRDAFDSAKRQLEEHGRKIRGDVKLHETPRHGKIVQLALDMDYGKIETFDGREIYFHKNSLINDDFTKLKLGQEVRFNEEAGEQGPQATSVKTVGKHHVSG